MNFNFGGINTLNTAQGAVGQIKDLLRGFSIRDLATRLGFNMHDRVCVPRSCHRFVTRRAGCIGRGRWRRCWGERSHTICVPPFEICVNSPFRQSEKKVEAADVHPWTTQVEKLFTNETFVEYNFPKVAELFATDAKADETLDELDVVQTLYGMLSLGAGASEDAASHEAHVKEIFSEVGTILAKVGEEHALKRSTWVAKKHVVLAHVKHYIMRKTAQHSRNLA